MNRSVPSACGNPAATATSGRATRIRPSAPTPKCRSHSAAARSWVSSIRPLGSSSITKSLPVPWYLANAIVAPLTMPSSIAQVLRHLVDDPGRPVRPGPEPPNPRVPPEPRHLASGQRLGPPHRHPDGLLERDLPLQVADDLSVPDGLPRGE